MSSVISIIIPCFNSGEFLPEALESIKACTDSDDYEVIIVNDGSTDHITLALLDELASAGYKIIHQENKGPAAARNTGVKASNATFLLFLDSDNKLRLGYISKALKILESSKEIGVVYGAPNFFGDTKEARFTPQEFSMYTILKDNYIDICAVVRREVWESVGGFDEERLLIGREDWDFWIMAGATGWKFHFINEVLYDYRIRCDSVIVSANQNISLIKVLTYLHSKHREVFIRIYDQLYQKKLYYENEHRKPFRLFFKNLYHKYIISKVK